VRRLEQRPELLFRFLSFRDVADRAHRYFAFAGLQRAEADLDGELRSVFALAVELETGSHGARPRVEEIIGPVPDSSPPRVTPWKVSLLLIAR
jgi:hypothetical protein